VKFGSVGLRHDLADWRGTKVGRVASAVKRVRNQCLGINGGLAACMAACVHPKPGDEGVNETGECGEGEKNETENGSCLHCSIDFATRHRTVIRAEEILWKVPEDAVF